MSTPRATSASVIDPMATFGPDRLAGIPIDEAIHRVRVYGTTAASGFGPYDLAGAQARRAGHFELVSPWSLLWADALAGGLSVDDVAAFSPARRREFATLVSKIDATADLAAMAPDELSRVVRLCQFGFPRVRAAKITKMGAMYRPLAVPILDGHVAQVFGYKDGFSGDDPTRDQRIRDVVEALARWLANNSATMNSVRGAVIDVVPAITEISDVRLLDIILWTSQDDQLERENKKKSKWLTSEVRHPLDPADWGSIPL